MVPKKWFSLQKPVYDVYFHHHTGLLSERSTVGSAVWLEYTFASHFLTFRFPPSQAPFAMCPSVGPPCKRHAFGDTFGPEETSEDCDPWQMANKGRTADLATQSDSVGTVCSRVWTRRSRYLHGVIASPHRRLPIAYGRRVARRVSLEVWTSLMSLICPSPLDGSLLHTVGSAEIPWSTCVVLPRP